MRKNAEVTEHQLFFMDRCQQNRLSAFQYVQALQLGILGDYCSEWRSVS